ncbi:MAG: SUMF1/EgtB/PvdO family nonheme iron enzyme [Verrucomicrobiales bacterium]|nr:SUMF1/EgtB/PvdO family nonheme iron enzyme [Verrucomicrobiales bacterium]
MSNPSTLKPGQLVGPGRFTLIKELGRGGMGVVWLARDTSLGEQVALKFLPPEVCHDPVALNDLRRETVKSHRLTHPNIIRIHDFHQQPDGVAFISMEYVDGMTLSGWRLQQQKQVFPWPQLAPLVQQLCAALQYAHGEGVIHRDLKPANVMVDTRGRVKLADFGIAAVVSDSMSRVSARSSSGGTLAYMSPQQLRGQQPSVGDDIYALGASLYELLTGRPPFYTGDITHQVLNEAPAPLVERALDLGVDNPVPPEVGALVMACLGKEVEQRPASAQAVAAWVGLVEQPATPVEQYAAALGTVANEPEPAAAPEAGAGAPPRSPAKRGLWPTVGVVGVLLLAALGWLVLGGKEPLDQAGRASSSSVRWTNTLGMVFVPVPGTDVQFSIWETRVQDFDQFVKATGREMGNVMVVFKNGRNERFTGYNWKNPGFDQGSNHPVVGTSWDDAKAFCNWLTAEERKKGRLEENQAYRLPTDQEWNMAVGLGRERGATPRDRSGTTKGYPWGTQWPPPAGSGNFAGEEVRDADWPSRFQTIAGYNDGYARTSPVGAFPPNHFGLHDLEGNVIEWVEDLHTGSGTKHTARWGTWFSGSPDWCSPSFRTAEESDFRASGVGFRIVRAKLTAPQSRVPEARESARWTNSLGMVFVPVPGTKVKFCVWETRVQDFRRFSADTGHDAVGEYGTYLDGRFQQVNSLSWNDPGFPQSVDHPVCGVNWSDAKAFCQWLTQRERTSGVLQEQQTYRLPTDLEWSAAVGLGAEAGSTPKARNVERKVFPWGTDWPPSEIAGNYFGEEAKDRHMPYRNVLEGYNDGFAKTAPVASFPANALGLFDLGGNVWEWCEDWFDEQKNKGVLRGGAWDNAGTMALHSAARLGLFERSSRMSPCGFRVVLSNGSSSE